MEERPAQGYVLTLHLAADDLSPAVAESVVRELSHLSAVRGPAEAGNLLIHCTVSATSESDAVRYAAQRTVSALLGIGIEAPKVLSVEACLFDQVSA